MVAVDVMVRGLVIVLVFAGFGALVSRATTLPLPGAVVGLVAFVFALRTKLVKRAWVEEACGFLTGRMALFLVPASVAVFDEWDLVGPSLLPIVVASVVSTLLVLVVVGKVAQALTKPGLP